MFESIDSLKNDIINIQLLDLYFKDGGIRMEGMFFREDYIYEMEKLENLLSYYENSSLLNDSDDDDQYLEEESEYTLDDVLELLVADLDIYSLIYKVPEVKIKNVEWELLFTTIANYYQQQEFSYFFMNDMVDLNKMAIAKAMVYEDDSIDLKTYISSLKYLESDVLSITNIVEITEKLGEVFGIDALSLIANEDGSFGCIGKGSELVILSGEDTEDLDKVSEQVKIDLEKKGYNTVATLDVNNEEKIKTEENVVDFSTYKAKSKKKI